ncbi:DUF3857 domain-containing protein [Paludibacterium purpuratum]|uniref:Uncharacterized protein DUF3857 n=1 Tax=Paludibacterium purpuratum TaxID=1144873 RepID=A0A4V6PZA7_9NEIS|nr:DUF3857 domain-containing protein [Paludibacterium purpuratum]TDR81559.1 uncharacterized protein DUF3857 [Paludibacterium purpuratum]
MKPADFALVLFPLLANASPYQPTYSFDRDDTITQINEDGRSLWEETAVASIGSKKAVEALSQQTLSYNADRQEVKVLEAYTTTADGRRIDVPAEKIFDQSSPRSRYASMYGNFKVKVVVFPEVDIGAKLTVHWQRLNTVARWPNALFDNETVANLSERHQATSHTLKAPEGMVLHWQSLDVPPPEVRHVNGQQILHWRFPTHPGLPREDDAVGSNVYSPQVVVTNVGNDQTAADAYWSRARSAIAVTPVVQKLADRITVGLTDPHARAVALYEWARKNLRHIDLELWRGDVVPHTAEQVIKNGYADSKDAATLLQALMAACHLRSSQALVMDRDSLPTSINMPLVDHDRVVLYLADEKRFIDPGMSLAPFGQIDSNVLGQEALVIDPESGKAQRLRMPVLRSDQDQVTTLNTLTWLANGDMEGQGEVNFRGAADLLARYIFRDIEPGTEDRVTERLLNQVGLHGTGRFQLADIQDTTRPMWFRSNYRLSQVANMPGPAALRLPEGVGIGVSIRDALETSLPDTRHFPFEISAGMRIEHTEIRLPQGLQILSLPKPVQIENRFGHYRASYQVQDGVLKVERSLQLDWPSTTVMPRDYPDFKALGDRVRQDLHAQVLYRMP